MTSTIDSLKRASAACHAATDFAPARRGMFALVERRHLTHRCCTALIAGYIGYTPAIVSSVDRAGTVKEVWLIGQDWPLKRRDWNRVTVDNKGMLSDPARVAAALVDDRGHAIEFKDQTEAVAAIKAAAGVAS